MTCLRIAKAGFFSGDPEKVARARVDIVLNIVAYTSFLNELEEVTRKLNEVERK